MMQKLPKKPTAMGPADSFTGDVYLDGIRGAMDGSRLNMAHVHFAPGARTHWHSHPVGQTLFCTDGSGLVVSRDGTVLTIEPGQTVCIRPPEVRWRGARADAFRAQRAPRGDDEEGEQVTWLEPVADAEFARANTAARENG